jgi:ribosome-associated protein
MNIIVNNIKERKNMQSKEFVQKICKVLSDKKGEDILSIDVRSKTDIADYYVIAGGRSMTHTRSLIEHVEEEMDKIGVAPIRREGVREGRWAVLDYGDVVVHIFNDESRLFYHLESLWADDKNVERY